MKIYFKFMLVLIASAGLALTSCRKAASSADTASVQDNSNVSQHMNAAVDDAANAAGNSGVAGKTTSTNAWILQGATIDSTQIASGTIVIIYDGSTIVDGRFKRSGSVTLTLNNYPSTHWKDAGAVLDLAFSNVKYTNVLNGNSYTYNGTTEIVNVSGGLAWRILAGLDQGVVTHNHKSTGSGVSITFPDGTVRSWNFNRVRSYSNGSTGISVTLSAGGGTEGGYGNVDAWGTNRKGNLFYNQITTPIVFNNTCNSNYRDPVSGEDMHHVGGFSLDVLFGVDATGAVTTSCPDYGYRVTYTNSRNQTQSAVFQYWH